ncbi:conjugal transfer mating pair stabilization protein TraG [Gammaproteobacteria bacterium]
MSNPLPIYVISNGDLARETLNAVATLLSADTFSTAMRLSVLFSIYGAVVNYIRGHNIAVFAKWFITYFGIAVIMLAPKVTLQIFDASNPGIPSMVANIPYGLGYPASIITSTAHGIVQAFEKEFHTPDDLSYNKTGMLFGSKLFKISSEFNTVDPAVKSELNEYVKNCVLGDILISKKYSMTELTESTNLLDTITKNPSHIRGIYIDGVFKTCQAATESLKKHLETDVKNNLLANFGRRIGIDRISKNLGSASDKAEKSKTLLESAYHHFNYGNLSSSALEIATQNVLINGIRDGLLNYTAETGATAALLNLSTSQAMDKMRMSLATSRNVALYTIPIIHTVLLLLMLSLFPVIVLLSLQPSLTGTVLKNYLYTLFWIESWPIMFSCLNMMITFYAKELGSGGLTISNIDKLLLEHSDISNMAGYLMLSIPFISGGLVKGMSSAFNHAASYIGGVLQSSASSAASEAVSGNIHLGNSSWHNINANKFDTNSTMMHGMATEQLGTGVLRTSRPDGKPVYDASHAISKLPVNVRASDMLSESFSKQAEVADSAAVQNQKSYDQSLSSAITDLDSLGKSVASSKSLGESFSSREAASYAQSATEMKNIAKTIADRNHLDVNDVFRGLVNFSQTGTASLGITIPGKAIGVNIVDGKLDGKLSTEHMRTSESSTQHNIGKSIDVTAEEAKRFSTDMHKVEEYSKTKHVDTGNSEAASYLSQLSTDLRSARSASEQYSVHKSESERLANSATLVRQHSGQIDSDLGQEIADYAVKIKGREKAEQLFAGKNRPELENLARDYVHSFEVENKILSTYQRNSSNINPHSKYHLGEANVESKANTITTEHENQKLKNASDAKKNGVGVDQQEFNRVKDDVSTGRSKITQEIGDAKSIREKTFNEAQNGIIKNIQDGAEKAASSAYNIVDAIKPQFLNAGKNNEKTNDNN